MSGAKNVQEKVLKTDRCDVLVARPDHEVSVASYIPPLKDVLPLDDVRPVAVLVEVPHVSGRGLVFLAGPTLH